MYKIDRRGGLGGGSKNRSLGIYRNLALNSDNLNCTYKNTASRGFNKLFVLKPWRESYVLFESYQ